MRAPDLTLYLVTDAPAATRAGHRLPALVQAAVRGGVTTVQVREKNSSTRDFLNLVLEIGALLPDHVSLLVNDRVDVYLAARHLGAAVTGVHLGQQDLPVAVARELIGAQAILGLSAARPQQIEAAAADPARVDYLGIGALHSTASKPDAPPPLGVPGMLARARLSRLPVVAIGGVTVSDAGALRGAGLAGIAVLSGICAAADPALAAARYRSAWAGAA